MIALPDRPRSLDPRALALAGFAILAALAAVEATGASAGWWFSWARELSVSLLILFAAWSTGRLLLRVAFGAAGTGLAEGFAGTALGLGVLATATFAAGLAGVLRPLVLWLLVAAASLPGLAGALAPRPPADRTIPGAPRDDAPPPGWPSWPGRAAVAVLLSGGFLYASLPPVFYDTLVYHLGLPNLYLATGSLTYWSGSYLASYPQNAEMLNVIAVALGGEKAAQILMFAVACLVALLVRRIAGREAGTPGADLAFLFLAAQWPFWFGACFGKNDLTGALFLLASLALALDESPPRPLRTAALAGAIAGFGVGVKLTNALPALLIACAFLVHRRAARADRLRRAAVFGLAVLVTTSPWLARNAMHRGNPFFPAFYSVLGGRGFSPEVAARMERDTLQAMDRSPRAVALRVAGIGFDRERYASGGELSPLTMPLLVAGLALSRRRETAAALGIALATLVAGVGYLSAVVRVYAAAWMLAPLSAAAVFARFRGRAWRAAVALIVLAGSAAGLVFSARMLEAVSAGGSRVFLGRLDPSEYLSERVNYIGVAEFANERLPEDARILVVGSARTAYFRRRCEAPSAWDDAWIARASRPGADPIALRAELREMGYTHVLLNVQEMRESEPARRSAGILDDPDAAVRLDRFFRALRPVARDGGCILFEVGA